MAQPQCWTRWRHGHHRSHDRGARAGAGRGTVEGRERDVPVATAQGLAVSATVAEVVYKTSPFEIVVVVDNPTDQAVEITVWRGNDPISPAFDASIRGEGPDSDFDLLPVRPEGIIVWCNYIRLRREYKVPAGARLSLRREVDWRNYPERIDRIDPGHYRLLLYFSYALGDNTASSDPPADRPKREIHRVGWRLALEIRDEEA